MRRSQYVPHLPWTEGFRTSIEIEFFIPIQDWRPDTYSRKLAFSRYCEAILLLAANRDMAEDMAKTADTSVF